MSADKDYRRVKRTLLVCPDCGEDIWGDDDGERQRYWDLHLGTVGHKLGELGAAGRVVREAMVEARDDFLEKHGFIPPRNVWSDPKEAE